MNFSEFNTFSLITLGCKVNQCDSDQIQALLEEAGWISARSREPADLVIVNTCCVTGRADRKSRFAIRGALNRKRCDSSLLAVVGCYPGYDFNAIASIKGVDRIFTHEDRPVFQKWLTNFIQDRKLSGPQNGSKGCGHQNSVTGLLGSFKRKTRAFLKVQEGCDYHCRYCIVRKVRGSSRSLNLEEALQKAQEAVSSGCKELVLTGVCLGSYGQDFGKKIDLVDLVGGLEQIEGLERIRLSSIEPADVTDRLIEKMATCAKLCPHLHLPFQSGDDEVLSWMNRRCGVRDYLSIFEKAKKKIPRLSVSCDMIVGFPGEADRHFQNSLSFLKLVEPLRTHLFSYSPRQGAMEEPGLSSGIVRRRFESMRRHSEELSLRFRQKLIGEVLSVLFERRNGNFWSGYAENYFPVRVKIPGDQRNRIKKVKLLDERGRGRLL